MRTPYLMMSTRSVGSRAFTDRDSLLSFSTEQAEQLSVLLELMTACDDQFLLQKTVGLAHSMAHELQVATYVLEHGTQGQQDIDWQMDDASLASDAAVDSDEPRAAA